MGYYKSLQRYYQNGCVLHPGKPPAWGEVNYKKYMQKQISDLGIKPGDVIAVEERWHSGTSTNTKGTVLSIDNNRIWILTQGKKIWKDRSNQKNVLIEYITKINKLEDAGPDFNICEADPDYKVKSIMYEEESRMGVFTKMLLYQQSVMKRQIFLKVCIRIDWQKVKLTNMW